MITEAYISGGINKAVFKKGEEYFILEQTSNNEYRTHPLTDFDLNAFSLGKPEVTVVEDIQWDNDKIQSELNRDVQKQEALNFFLMGMDTTLSEELRKESIELLQEILFLDNEIETFVKRRVFATKIPESFNPLSASEFANVVGNKHLRDLYKNLFDAKDIIIAVRSSWEKTILEHNYINKDISLELIDREFTDRGIFSDFVLAILEGNFKEIDKAILLHSETLQELKISGLPAVWLFQIKQFVFEQLSINFEKSEVEQLEEVEKEDQKYDEVYSGDFDTKFSEAIDTFKGRNQRKKEGKKWRDIKLPPISRFFRRDINKQVIWIKKKIKIGNLEDAKSGILGLVEFQDFYSEQEHLCKSLSDIAECFQKNNDINNADFIAKKAVELNLNDSVPYCILAENLRARLKLKDALRQYERTILKFNNDVVSRSGKAETLRQMGRLNEALKVYDDTIQLFQNDVVPRNGKAETLRQMGKLDEALKVYEDTIKLFKNDVISICGKAETLRQMGRLNQALKVYDDTIQLFQNDVFARSGKAETLRQMGKLDEALKVYDDTIQLFKNEVVPRSGKAETLRQMGKLDEALKVYDDTIQLFKNDVVPRSGKAETLRQMGKLDEALKVYEDTIRIFKYKRVPLCGKAETLRQMGKLDEALKIYDDTIQLFKNEVVPRSGKAETLRQMGKLDEALKVYDDIIQLFKNDVVPRSGKAETLRQMGKLDEALKVYDETVREFKYDKVALCGKAETLRQIGRLEESLIIYNKLIELYPNDSVINTARYVLLIQRGKNLEEIEKEISVLSPKSINDWKLHHVYCMLLIKQDRLDSAIQQLQYGLNRVEAIRDQQYYLSALSYAFIRKKQYDKVISNLKQESHKQPLLKVFVTHAYAAAGDIKESRNYFTLIINSQIQKIDNTAKYLSDRYKIVPKQFFIITATPELDRKIEELEFDLLAESLSLVA